MIDMDILRERLSLEEGRRDFPYDDATGNRHQQGVPVKGKLTVGVGRNIDDVPFSDDEIKLMLTNDINKSLDALDKHFPWWRKMDPVRQSVLADMCFNLGINKLRGFVNTLRMMEAGDYEGTAKGMLKSLWASQVKHRAEDLSRMMRTGEY